ncbi:MAG: glycosyltransferase family 2 protein [Parasporobacterium sp.]|nr:glycosyltransferase family 2 protein [Parasporobacterium sp.]
MKILIIIPAYNEEKNIEKVVETLKTSYPQYSYVVVNDGSSDNTEKICIEKGYSYVSHPVNLGLQGAVQTGMRYAKAHDFDAAIQFDGDGQHSPEFIGPLAAAIEEGYDIAIGSRFVTEKKPKSARMFGNNLIMAAVKITTGKTIKDTTSGMRMFNRKMISILAEAADMGPEPDTVALLIRKGAKVKEVQVTMSERTAGESYLTFTKSVNYMARMMVSILFLQWFRKGK